MQNFGYRDMPSRRGHDGRLDRGIRATETNDNTSGAEFH
jgi:hypothetical protein